MENQMNKLKYLRKKHHLKQSDVAKLLFITQPNYSKYENNQIPLNLEYAKILAEFYKVPITFLFDINDVSIKITIEELKVLSKAKEIIENLEQKVNKTIK